MNFAGRYTYAYDQWKLNNTCNVSGPWTVAFQTAAGQHSNVTQDLVLGMNAHINYDLAIIAYQQGYANLQMKDDFDRVNDLMTQIGPNITYALGSRYDPFLLTDNVLLDYFFSLTVQLIIQWRTAAWTTALSYQSSLPVLVPSLMLTNEQAVSTVALALSFPYFVPTAPDRIAYCSANHAPF